MLKKSNKLLQNGVRRMFSSDTKHTGNSGNVTNRRRFLRQSQGLHAFRPEEIPTKPTIILFPGQGSQFVGMAKSLVNIPEAKEMFDIASEVLRFLTTHKINVWKVMNKIE